MKVHSLFGSTLALGVLAGAPLPAQSQGIPIRPVRPPMAVPVTGKPMPEKYVRKFGVGDDAEQKLKRLFLEPPVSREEITEALDAATYLGRGGTAALAMFGLGEMRLTKEDPARDVSWSLLAVDAMMKVPGNQYFMPLREWALRGKTPELRAKALRGMIVMVSHARYEIPVAGRRAIRTSALSTDKNWNSLGDSIDLRDLDMIENVAQSVLWERDLPANVKAEADALMAWIKARKEQDQKLLAAQPAP